MRFVPKYLDRWARRADHRTLRRPENTARRAVRISRRVLVDRWGHRKALVVFTAISICGYVLVLAIPHWGAVIAAPFYFWLGARSRAGDVYAGGRSLPPLKHTMGIGIQSLIKRVPIIIGPLVGGFLIDRFGVVAACALHS